MEICLVWAQGRGRVIGRDGDLPWRLPEDLAHFKRTTLGSPIIMGRKTWESIGSRPLPGRLNIVVSTRPAPAGSVALWAESLDHALQLARQRAEPGASGIYVIGGASLYRQALLRAHRLSITEVDVVVPNGDTFAPSLPPGMFAAPARGEMLTSSTGLRYRILSYQRAPAKAYEGPVLAYHGTFAEEDFHRFERTDDIGFHFGTVATANRRLEQVLEHCGPDEAANARVLVCHLNIRRPLRLADCHTWSTQNVLLELHNVGVLSDERYDQLSADGYLDHEGFRDIVEAAGFDSVVYANETEGGGDSFIVLRTEHITFAMAGPSKASASRRARP